ncbi:MAG TPA: HDOD domain-containing protein [Dissulfurispiraceae bacterium]|nr:HDOD domain-containing protein [Dissulfurispiraceae bacterium]
MDDIQKKISFDDLHIPGLPDTSAQLVAALQDNFCSVQKLEELICRDPALTAEVLKIVNAPLYASGKSVNTVAETIMFIGLGNLVSLVSIAALTNACMKSSIDKEIIRHLLAVSSAATQLAEQADAVKVRREIAVVAGLLHDIGKVVIFTSLPQEYSRIHDEAGGSGRPFAEVEQEMLGFNHCAVGVLLARRWHFPLVYQHALEHHHDEPISEEKLSEADALCYIVRAADKTVLDAGIGVGTSTEQDLPKLLKVLDIGQPAYERIAKNIASMKTLSV